MKKQPPPLIIVANRGHLVAYQLTEHGSLKVITDERIDEGNARVSEIYADQSGAFPVSGGPGTASFERMPLIAELEMRCFRRIASLIEQIVRSENPAGWGFSAPSEINGAILDGVEERCVDKLSVNLQLDLTNSPADVVAARFRKGDRNSGH